MKNYVQPELIFVRISHDDVLVASGVDLTERDHFDFGSTNPWGEN